MLLSKVATYVYTISSQQDLLTVYYKSYNRFAKVIYLFIMKISDTTAHKFQFVFLNLYNSLASFNY